MENVDLKIDNCIYIIFTNLFINITCLQTQEFFSIKNSNGLSMLSKCSSYNSSKSKRNLRQIKESSEI